MSEQPSRLVSLPVEVWGMIFQRLPPSRGYAYLYDMWETLECPAEDETLQTLVMISLVCRAFHSMIRPLIYHRVYIEASSITYKNLFKAIQSMERLKALLKSHPQIASCILEFDIGFPMRLYSSPEIEFNDWPTFETLMNLTLNVLPLLTSLCNLTLSRIEISNPILEVIPQITSIRSLKLENLLADSADSGTSEASRRGLATTHLTMLGYRSWHQSPHASLARAGTVFFGSTLTHLDTDLAILYAYLHDTADAQLCLQHVVSLRVTLTTEDIPRLPVALQTLQSVTSLIFHMDWCEVSLEGVQFTRQCVPALKEFSGPLGLALCILPGRPIHKIAVECTWNEERRMEEIIKLIGCCTSRLSELKVELAVWPSESKLSEWYPIIRHAKRFEIVSGRLRKEFLTDIKDFTSGDLVMPELEEISWVTFISNRNPPGDITLEVYPDHVEWLRRSSAAFPSLKTFICDGFCWSFDKGEWTKSAIDNEREIHIDRVAALREPR